jgi:F420-dependent oxidoreductase-like protein
MKLKFGVFIDPLYIPSPYRSLEEQALDAERLGFESVWVSDHLMLANKPIVECFTTLSALATLTQNIRLGSLVACNSYRSPALLAKMGATLDIISQGRLEFGIGAGWNAEEYRAYGIPFPPPRTRIAQMREGIEIIKRMWTQEAPTFTGEYFSIEGAHCEPKPIQKPHPPITVGGSGEQLTLKAVAEYADRSNWMGSVAEFAHKMGVLQDHCAQVGRAYDEIEKSWMGRAMVGTNPQELKNGLKQLYRSGRVRIAPPQPFDDWLETEVDRGLIGSPSHCLAKIHEYADLGVTYFMIGFLDAPSPDNMELFSETVIA